MNVHIVPTVGRATKYAAPSVTPLLQSATNSVAYHARVVITRETPKGTTTAEHGIDVFLTAEEIDRAYDLLHGGPR